MAERKLRGTKLLKYLMNFLICLLMSLILTYLLISAVLNSTILNPGFGVRALDNSNYAARCTNDIKKSLIYLGQPSNIPEKVFSNSLSTVEVRKLLISYAYDISNFLAVGGSKFEFEVDSLGFEKKLDVAINNYAAEQRIKIDASSTKSIREFIDECAIVYKNGVIINRTIIEQLRKLISPFVRYTMYMLIALFTLGVLQLIVNRSVAKVVHWLGISFSAVGFMVLAMSSMSFILRISDRLNVEPDYFKDLVKNIFSGVMTSFTVAGFALSGAGFLFIIAYLTTKKQYIAQYREQQEIWGYNAND